MSISKYKFSLELVEEKKVIRKVKRKNKKKENEKDNISKPHWMLYVTPSAGITGIWAAANGIYTLVIAEWILVASSVLYWSDPNCSWKRIVDICVVHTSLFIHMYYIYLYKDMTSLLLYLLAICSFVLGHLLNSNIAHSFVWWFACAGNITLTNSIIKERNSSFLNEHV